MLKEGLSIDTAFNPHKFSSDSTFKPDNPDIYIWIKVESVMFYVCKKKK